MRHQQTSRTKYLLEAEESQLRTSLDRCLRINHDRQTIMLRLALETGARISELLAITSADLIDEERAVYVVGLKGGRDRIIPLRESTFLLLKALEAGKLFPFSDTTARRCWYDIRPVAKKFHSLRHTFAKNIYEKSKDIRLVSRLLGHKSVLTTMIYLDHILGIADVRAAMQLED